jgi:SAM-dependent methyltransferase
MSDRHDITDAVLANYSPTGLLARVRAYVDALPNEGPTSEQLAPIDQFHTGGLSASAKIGELLDLRRGARVLDLGSGLGGPARYLAHTRGLVVHGIDLSPAFVEASRFLTERSAVPGVSFETGDVSQLAEADSSFDGAIMLHVAMNVQARERLYAEIARVLRPGSPFITYDVVSIDGAPDFPVPWASEPGQSWLLMPNETKARLESAGFRVTHWELDSERAAESFAGLNPNQPPPLGTVLGLSDVGRRIANLRESLIHGHTSILTARAVRMAT